MKDIEPFRFIFIKKSRYYRINKSLYRSITER